MTKERKSDRIIQVGDICIGNSIRYYREKAGLKQTDLVRMLQIAGIDISIYSYNRIEKGTQNPTVSFLLQCSTLLSCSINDLFSASDDSSSSH